MTRFAYAIFGYLAAALIAVAVAVFAIMAASALFSNGTESFLAPTDAGPAYIVGLEYTLPTALPGFLITLFAARRAGWTGWLPYAGAGTLNAALAWAIFDVAVQLIDRGPLHMPLSGMPPMILLPCLLGGFAGGITYWAVARNALRGRLASA